ncbi:hypothetical protein DYE50_04745 [Treponema ruminis]|uniref:Uncharacterized protein n=1 Tax=Treponema ruminis TaxID=744515 RepID=A0A7W8G7D4_9SPIR|nr:hypothetical protein [Treponema ruminis]MBB5225247.1 hypothetical protein [Treponema ruminis]QSI01882.1 hypothetical protein DYE50_04745 [Treponema ruminis]
MKLKKFLSFSAFSLVFSLQISPLFAQSDSDFDDVDSLFETSEDSESAIVTSDSADGTNYNIQLGSLEFPIEISGNMNTELGGAFIREDQVNDATFYFDFKNYIYFITRPDKYLTLRGTLKTTMPKDSSDTAQEQSNHLLYIYEMYFDYLVLDHLYITAGKKKSVWGNIRLFSDYYDEKENITTTDNNQTSDVIDNNVYDAQYTNVLYDSREYISGIIKIPFWNHTFTALAMYNDETNVSSTKTENMSLAASLELIFFNTSINFFGRRFKLKETEESRTSSTTQLPIVGMELKRTLFNFDVYGQSIARVQDGTRAKEIFNSNFQDLSTFNRIVSTVGTYRMWTEHMPYFGFNIEFQNIYKPNPSATENYFTNRMALQVGMAKLGPDRNIKPAIQWNHNFTDHSGFIKPGIIFSRVLPHCDWKIGAKYEYGKVSIDPETGEQHKYTKLTAGTYITINLDY